MGSAMDIDVVGAFASGCIPRPVLPPLILRQQPRAAAFRRQLLVRVFGRIAL
jgi:hypothetical protein